MLFQRILGMYILIGDKMQPFLNSGLLCYQNIFWSQSNIYIQRYQMDYDDEYQDSVSQDQQDYQQQDEDEDETGLYEDDYNQQSFEEDEQNLQGEEANLEDVQNQWQEFMQQSTQNQDWRLELISRLRQLTEAQQKYVESVQEKAQIKYYKMQFKFGQKVNEIYQGKNFLNGRKLFEILLSEFKRLDFELCSITVKTYQKDHQSRQHKYEQKITRVEREIENILKSNCYNIYVPYTFQLNYKMIPIQLYKYQYIHFTVKLPQGQPQKLNKLKRTCILANIQGKWANLRIGQNKYDNKDFLSVTNNSYCNSLKSWDLGCRVKSGAKQSFYTYFQPTGQQWITFSRSMQKDEESKIHEICVYNSYDSSIVLKTVIKKQQIYLLSFSSNKKDVYIFLSSPPIYEFAIIPPNTYCLPNYLNNWERTQNFLFLKHKYFKENDFLRLFLYSNSYMHLKLNELDEQSCSNIRMDFDLIQFELNCRKEELPNDIQNSKQSAELLKLFDVQYIKSRLNFIDIPDKPFLTAHTKWKLSYQIMLLIRFNVIGPDDLKDFLQLAEQYKEKIDQFIECLSRKSAGYTNKVSALNRFRKGVYEKFIQKIRHYFKELDKNISKSKHRKRFQQQSCLIYKVLLTPSGILPNPVSAETKCRLIRQYEKYTDFFLKVSLQDDVGQNMKNQKYMYSKIMRRLLDNVYLLGKNYVPLGWSGSQLRASSLWFVSEINKDEGDFKQMTQQSILNFLGDFSSIAVPAKKAARIGQAFSSSYCFDASNINQIIAEDNKSIKSFLFTDGIGMISSQLFQKICKQFKRKNIRINCCLQIRYKGAKGVLLVNEKLQGNSILLRKSMIKYECNHPQAKKYLDILNWDKYYSGYLNRQIIILLKSLNISDEVFLDFQSKYIQKLNSLDFSELDGNLLRVLTESDQTEDAFSLTIKSLKDHFNLSKDLFFQQFLQSIKNTKFTELKKKSRILIEKSARLIGVIDDYGVLNQGELYCAIKKNSVDKQEEKIKEVIEGDVIITRNPSLSPADVRRCRCVSLNEIAERLKKKENKDYNYFNRFVNCIVFPKAGAIPLTAQISGSDLDGDIFFICWEKNFIIEKQLPPQTLDDPNKKSPSYYGQATYRQMLDFFVDFANSEKLGRINNTHLVHADRSQQYANHARCKTLAAIHGKAVDYAKSGEPPEDVPQPLIIKVYPDFMEKWNKPTYESESVLGQLFRQCKHAIQVRKNQEKQKELIFSPEILKYLATKLVKPGLVKEVMNQLSKFEEDITDLLSHANVSNQFELYAGSSAENEELKNDFGRKRLSDWLQELRERHQSMFFQHEDKEIHKKQVENYRKLKNKNLKSVNVFNNLIKQKAALTYVVSYYCFCNRENPKIVENLPASIKGLCALIKKMQQHLKYQGHYLGFIWFIIPKIIINMQNARKRANKQKPQ